MRLSFVIATMIVLAGLPALAQTTAQPQPMPAAAGDPIPTPVGEAMQISETGTMSVQAEPVQPEPLVASGAVPTATLPHDLSPIGMFMAADIVVKGVMLLLAAASVVTWAVLVLKGIEVAVARRRIRLAAHVLTHSDGLRAAGERLAGEGTARTMLVAAADELAKSDAALDHVPADGVKERVSSRLARIEAGAGKKIAIGTGILATIGSISPFVGLFGTVWGIMNSFIGISQSQTTNLAIVAPGIAEALLATAIGLVAAIPAVVIYNVFARSIGGYRAALADARAAVERLVSRDLDFRAASRPRERRAEAAIARIG